MTSTVTLVADHLGSDAPRVCGTEYLVDAIIDVTDFNDSQGSLTVAFVDTPNTATVTAGTFDSSKYVVGQNLTIAGSDNEDGTVTITAINGAALTLSAVSADSLTDSGVTFSTNQEAIPYTTFGLRTVSQVLILGQEDRLLNWRVELGTDGNTSIADHLVLRCVTASSGALKTDDAGTIRVRLFGQI
jgi:hypothetical protein